MTKETCPECGWFSHERPENVREYDRSWEVHQEQLCPAIEQEQDEQRDRTEAQLRATMYASGRGDLAKGRMI